MKHTLFLSAAAVTAVCLLGACAGGPKPERQPGDAEARMERVLHAAPVLSGADSYFDGRVHATVTCSNGFGGEGPAHEGKEGRGPRHGGSGGHGGGGGHGEGPGGPRGEGGEAPEGPQMRMMESSMPPVMLRIELENVSDKPIKLMIWEFKSALGNFAVRPDTLTLAPGEKGRPDGMTSRLGLSSSALPVTLVLRLEGKEEKKVLTLKPVETPVEKEGKSKPAL